MLGRRICWLALGVAVVIYVGLFLNGWWGQGKGVYPQGSTPSGPPQPPLCSSEEIAPFIIPETSKDYRRDARPLLLEFHRSEAFYADFLSRRPDCVAALLAHYQRAGQPVVILLNDRLTGQTTARLAMLGDSLSR
jgi:hypothetical protein